jgi:nitroimidazol reductase NimA-like FMN-containing flavoprotein (pyridoxamine 5'-phosphate oxidase superfamily)
MTQTITTGKLTQAQMAAFLDHTLMARLTTAVPVKGDPTYFQPHAVPVWYLWDGDSLYISAFQSTRKSKEAKRNPYIAVIIDVADAIDGATAVLMEGKSEVIVDSEFVKDMSRQIYTRYMGEQGVLASDPQSWIVDPENSIIKLTPQRIYTW